MIKRGSVGVPWQLNPTPGGRGRKSEWRGAGSVGVFGRKSRERQARRWVRRLTMTWISDMRKGQKSSIHKMLAPLIQFPWKCCKKALLLRVSALQLTTKKVIYTQPAEAPVILHDVRRAQAFLLLRYTFTTRREAAFISLYGWRQYSSSSNRSHQ